MLNFVENGGIIDLLEFMKRKSESEVHAALRLVVVLISKGEDNTKVLAEAEDSVKILLKILDGPGLEGTFFKNEVYEKVIWILREMIKLSEVTTGDTKTVKSEIVDN